MWVSDMMEAKAHHCVKLNCQEVSDGEGGSQVEYSMGEAFKCYPQRERSLQARIAEAQGVRSLYNILISQSVKIALGDYYKDLTENAYFRVTSRPDENSTPATSTLDLKTFTAEKTELPGVIIDAIPGGDSS